MKGNERTVSLESSTKALEFLTLPPPYVQPPTPPPLGMAVPRHHTTVT